MGEAVDTAMVPRGARARRERPRRERQVRPDAPRHRRNPALESGSNASPEYAHGYHVVRGAQTAFSIRCLECEAKTCECVLLALACARRIGGGVIVYGPGGRVLQRREAVK